MCVPSKPVPQPTATRQLQQWPGGMKVNCGNCATDKQDASGASHHCLTDAMIEIPLTELVCSPR